MSFSKRFMSKSPFAFNAGLKEAAAKGKLDDNPKFKKAVESSGINKGSVAKEGKMTRTAGKLEKINEGGSDVLAALKAQLKIAKAPARRASIQKQIDKIISQQKEESLAKPPEDTLEKRNMPAKEQPQKFLKKLGYSNKDIFGD